MLPTPLAFRAVKNKKILIVKMVSGSKFDLADKIVQYTFQNIQEKVGILTQNLI